MTMNLSLVLADPSRQELWDRTVMESSQGTIFHLWDWLLAVQDHTRTELCPLLVFQGTTLVALYPVFFGRKGPFKVAFSPPPGAFLLYLGPVIKEYETMKQERRESVFLEIQKEVNRFIFQERGCAYARVRTVPEIPDSRPFRWTGYQVDPLYTYRLNLEKGSDSVKEGFNRKLRDSIRRAARMGVTVTEGSSEELQHLLKSLENRYHQQGIRAHDASRYLTRLMDRFSPDNLKVYCAWYQGERVGGMIATAFKSGMALWIGVPKTSLVGVAPNDLIQWQVIQDAIDKGFQYYELMDGGDNERLRFFKSKYNPELVAWYSAARYSSLPVQVAATLLRTSR